MALSPIALPRDEHQRPVRVLIVDDSISMRAVLRKILSSDPMIEVVGAAPDPYAARQMIKTLNPDVLTLDIEMPGMDGLSFLEKIMRLRPMPVIMCSSLTARGTEATIEALRLGAVDCIAKPAGNPLEIEQEGRRLCRMVRAAARSSLRRPIPTAPTMERTRRTFAADKVIGIGASTGGVEALFRVLTALPADCPPVLVVQHMPGTFTGGFAKRLNKDCAVEVVEAEHRMPIKPGTVYIAPGGVAHMELQGGPRGWIRLSATDPVGGHRPAVNVLFNSMAKLGSSAVGVILTGMGADGAQGLKQMRDAGARTFGQDEASCVVYGMPLAAAEAGAVEQELSLAALPEAILVACQK